MKQKENLTLHQVSLRALCRAPLQLNTNIQYKLAETQGNIAEMSFTNGLMSSKVQMLCPSLLLSIFTLMSREWGRCVCVCVCGGGGGLITKYDF